MLSGNIMGRFIYIICSYECGHHTENFVTIDQDKYGTYCVYIEGMQSLNYYLKTIAPFRIFVI